MLVGAVGISGMGWDEWYPEDLPPEWRLGYYANEFQVVLIPESDWCVWSNDDWQELDWPDHLLVIIEVSGASIDAFQRLLSAFEDHALAGCHYLCRDVETQALLPASSCLEVVVNNEGWSASDDDWVVSFLNVDVADLKSVRRKIEASEAWQAENGALLFDVGPIELNKLKTLVELLA